jgi:HlyD family secretion protein
MRKVLTGLVVLVSGLIGYRYLIFADIEFAPEIRTAPVTIGDVIDTVGATGTLEAFTTVQVGSQVSGIIQDLSADYNSIVREGDVIMRLDPSLFETQVEQARANLIRAEADVERFVVAVDDAGVQLNRSKKLAERDLISPIELEAAEVNLRSTQAQLKSVEAQVIQARASLNQNEVNLEHTIIRAPIDGIVISRLVDVGQTVAASLQAPELFVIAADLTKMRVIANIDEADVGRIRPNQRVTFSVDAFPSEEFTGSVSQIRLEPVVTQNVVTYATVVDAPNPDLRLKPGMTATISLETARRENVLRIPNTALRFRPTNDMFAALGQPPPRSRLFQEPPMQGRYTPSNVPKSNEPKETLNDERPEMERLERGGFSDPEKRRQFRERLAQMTPREREQLRSRQPAHRDPTDGLRANGSPQASSATGLPLESEDTTVPAVERGARTIDALFGALPVIETTGRVWRLAGNSLQQINVRLGVTDGTSTELLGVLEESTTNTPQTPPTSPQVELLREQLATTADATTRATLTQTIEQIESDSPRAPESLRNSVRLESLPAGTTLVTNITTPDKNSSSSGSNAGSPFIPQFGRRR